MPKIQFRRGNKNGLPALSHGEPALTLDTSELFIGGQNGNLQIPVLDQDGKVPEGQLPPDGSAAVQEALDEHVGDKNNPHEVTAAQVGASLVVKGTYPIASGYTISAGDVVDVEGGEVVVDRAIQANTENSLFSGSVADTAIVKLNNQYSVVVYVGSSAASQGQAILVNNSDGSSASSSWPSVGSGTISTVSIVRLNDAQFIVGYVRAGYFCVKIGTLSGTQISFGSEVQIELSDSGYATLVGLSETSVFAITSISNPLQSRGCVLTVSGTSVSKGNTYVIGNNIRTNQVSATLLPNDSSGNKRICACFSDANDSNKGKAIIASINSSNVVTWGEETTFNASYTTNVSCCTHGENVVVAYTDQSLSCYAKILSISGSTITASTESALVYPGNCNSISVINTGSAVVVSIDHDNAPVCGASIILGIQGMSITVGEAFQFNSSRSYRLTSAPVSNLSFIISYSDAGNSSYGTTIVQAITNSSSTAIALQSGTAGESIEVIFSGTTAASFVEAGQEITSEGVYGFGAADGFLSVIPWWSKNAGVKMATVSYVGTGTYGADNPNEITFDFVPKIVAMVANSDAYGNYNQTLGKDNSITILYTECIKTTFSKYQGFSGYYTQGNSYGKKSEDGKTFYWYSIKNAEEQFNSSGATFYCVALA